MKLPIDLLREQRPRSVSGPQIEALHSPGVCEVRGGALKLADSDSVFPPLKVLRINGKVYLLKSSRSPLLFAKHSVRGSRYFVSFSESSGLLGVSTREGCAYVINALGDVVTKRCFPSTMAGTSQCCGTIAFVETEGKLLLYFEREGKWRQWTVGGEYAWSVKLMSDGLLVGLYSLAFIDYDGNVRWSASSDRVFGAPAVADGLVFVARSLTRTLKGRVEVRELTNGKLVYFHEFDELVRSVDVCKDLVVVGSARRIILLTRDGTELRALWQRRVARSCEGPTCNGAWSVSFDKSCRRVAVADVNDRSLRIYDLEGHERIFHLREQVWDVKWSELLVVGADRSLYLTVH